MPVHPETMEISFKSKLYSSVFWNSKQLGMLHYNEESNIMKYLQERNSIVGKVASLISYVIKSSSVKESKITPCLTNNNVLLE